MKASDIIEALHLEAHVEGGYFKRSYCSPFELSEGQASLSSIYYLLTADSPVGHWHLNKSDIVHYFHKGNPIEYCLIFPDGRFEKVLMGPDLTQNQQLQLLVPGGVWKASRLTGGEFGLISEAVTPAFRYEDMTLGNAHDLQRLFPQHWPAISALVKQQ
jgi:predicted cupin superfamily sugar epimerase